MGRERGHPRIDLRETPPFATPLADLRRARLILIGCASVSMPEQQPFDAANMAGDYTMRTLLGATVPGAIAEWRGAD